jgi:hypothetical protein
MKITYQQNFRDTEVLKLLCIFFWQVEYVGHSFDYVAYFVVLRDVWIRT